MASRISRWTPARLTRQDGKTFVITGANSGIGFEAAKLLAGQGGHVIMLCRDEKKAEAAAGKIRVAATGSGTAEIVLMDLANLASVRDAAEELTLTAPKIDALVNNAGAMAPPERLVTADGFELQFGINHLGHFLLNGLLAANVRAADGRFVVVSSTAHKVIKRLNFDDLNWQKDYSASGAYAQSKLANALYALELNKRLQAAGEAPRGYICHPGYAATALQTKHTKGFTAQLMAFGNVAMAQSAARGSWPTALCATDTEVEAGKYYGPTGLFELWGSAGDCKLAPQAQDAEAAARLWTLSEGAVGHRWDI